MNQYRNRLPVWAYTNTLLLCAPIILGLGAFYVWFIPNHELRVPAFLFFVFYYVVVFYICKRTSRAKLWASYKNLNPTWREYSKTLLGFVMCSGLAYFGFYAVGPALATSVFGSETTKELTIASVSKVFRSHGCRYEIRFIDASPPMGGGFCVRVSEFGEAWAKGSKVTVYGRQSIFGFRFTKIGR
jgi:hypothetical protein